MPNITTNHGITYTNYANLEKKEQPKKCKRKYFVISKA